MPHGLLNYAIAEAESTEQQQQQRPPAPPLQQTSMRESDISKAEKLLNKAPFLRGMFDMVNNPVGLFDIIPMKTQPQYADPADQGMYIGGNAADVLFAPAGAGAAARGALGATRKGVGRVVTNLLEPDVYENKLPELLNKLRTRAGLKAVIQDQPLYTSAPFFKASEVPYREIFGLEPRYATEQYQTIDRGKKGTRLTFDLDQYDNTEDILHDIALLDESGDARSLGNEPTMGNYTIRNAETPGTYEYLDYWDFGLHGDESLRMHGKENDSALKGLLHLVTKKPRQALKDRAIGKLNTQIADAKARGDEAAFDKLLQEREAVWEERNEITNGDMFDMTNLQRAAMDKLLKKVTLTGTVTDDDMKRLYNADWGTSQYSSKSPGLTSGQMEEMMQESMDQFDDVPDDLFDDLADPFPFGAPDDLF